MLETSAFMHLQNLQRLAIVKDHNFVAMDPKFLPSSFMKAKTWGITPKFSNKPWSYKAMALSLVS
jgi:hypothetical protein